MRIPRGEAVLSPAYGCQMPARSVFACSACGHQSPKWHGRCPGCGEWNTLVEEAVRAAPARAGPRSLGSSARAARALRPVPLAEVEAPALGRLETGIGELDRVLGGGLVPGSMVLLGGAPGIGKSTITAGALGNLAEAGRKVLYVTRGGVGRPGQATCGAAGRGRAARAGRGGDRPRDRARHAPGGAARRMRDRLGADPERARRSTAAPGSVGQVREVAGQLMETAKRDGVRDDPGGPRHQGGFARRATRPRAPRRLRPPIRGRARAHLPDGPRAQEPLRLDQRGGRIRDARAGPGGGRRRLVTVRVRGDAGAWIRGGVRDGGLPAPARGAPGARRPHRGRAAATGRQRR